MKFLLYLSQNYSFEILRPLAKVMLDEGHQVKWFVEGNEVNRTLFHPTEAVLPTVDDAVAFHPDAVFLPGNVVPPFIPGLKVQLFHGFEWKKKGHFKIRECFDLYCTQGPFFTEKFLELRQPHPHFTVKETGWPKLDALFNMHASNQREKDAVEILYAPTFSPSLTSTSALFNEIVKLSQQKPWVWKVKFHPKMEQSVIDRYKAAQHDKLVVVEDASILPLLSTCDVMLSDTSSAITEFLLLNKPVVTFNNAQPEPVLIDITASSDLEAGISQALACDATLMSAIKAYRNQMHPYDDGASAQRVLAATIEEIREFPRSENVAKPKNWFRNFKLRKRLNYWRR